jgi:hypothetical protein
MMLAKLLVITDLLCTPFCVSTISPFFKIEQCRNTSFKLCCQLDFIYIFEITTYRQTLSLILQEQGVRPYKAHTSLRKSTTSFVFIVVSKFDLSKYCIIYSKILICVIAFYSPSLQGLITITYGNR